MKIIHEDFIETKGDLHSIIQSEQNSEYNWEITRTEIELCYEIIVDKQTKGKREKKKS